jgi:DNA gyrase subunit A
MSNKLRIFKGRSSKGIKGIQLSENDSIISLSVVNSVKINGKVAKKTLKNGNSNKNKLSEIIAMQKYILSITKNGYGKSTSFYDFKGCRQSHCSNFRCYK